MKRVRWRVMDSSGWRGCILIPATDEVDFGLATDMMQAYDAITRPSHTELCLQEIQLFPVGPGGSGDTPLVKDVAVMTFTSEGPFGLKVPLLGPGPIFLADDLTINENNPDVAAFIAIVLGYGTDRQGLALTGYVAGRRAGAGGP